MRTLGSTIALAAAIAALVGCSAVIEAILLPDAPSSLAATDGEYGDSIVLTWNAPDATDDSGNERTVSHYEIDRSPGFSLFTPTSTFDDGTSWSDDDVSVGTLYRYRVRAVFDDSLGSDRSNYSVSDTGFAMDAVAVRLHPTPAVYQYALDDDGWFSFPLQRGWRYHIAATSGAVSEETVTLLYGSSLTVIPGSARETTTVTTKGGLDIPAVAFTAPDSETVYVHVQGPPTGAGSVAFLYGYDE